MLDKIKKFIEEKKLIEKGDKIVLGLSGGADSICLLLVLQKLFGQDLNLLAVHVNHGIRGEEAKRDEDFVKAFCAERKVEVLVREADVPALAKKEGCSIEEAGRNVRYKILYEVLEERNYQKIAVAHNKEDATETFFIHLARGSGLRGLTGIKERKDAVIRPLLRTERREILEFLKEEKAEFMIDSTNLESCYTRNAIRNEVFPILQSKVNEGFVSHVSDTIAHLREVYEYIGSELDKIRDDFVEPKKDGLKIKVGVLQLPSVLRRELLYEGLIKTAGSQKDLGFGHVKALERLLTMETGKKIDFPYRVEARKGYGEILIHRKKVLQNNKLPLPILETEIIEIGEIQDIQVDAFEITLMFSDGKVKKLPQRCCMRWFDYDRITEILEIRKRKEGDFITISADGKRKKLKAYLRDEKIPEEERGELALVASGSEILWVFGGRTGESARISLETRRLIRVEIKKMEDRKHECTD